MGRTVGLLCQILTPSKEIKNVLVDQSTYTDPIPGVRYFMTENGGSKQSILSEILAVCINFLFTGLVPFLICLSIIAWYSVRARCKLTALCVFCSNICSFLPHVTDSCEGIRRQRVTLEDLELSF